MQDYDPGYGPEVLSIPANHLQFIQLVAEGKNKGDAYSLSIGKKSLSKNAVQVGGSKFAKKYAKEIGQARERLGKALEQAHDLAASTGALNGILSKAERMQILTKIIHGKIKVKNKVTVAGKTGEVEQPATLKDRISAIGELNKMDGSYAPVDINTAITEIRRTVISKKV